MIHLNLTAKIWLSIGIFVSGFVVFAILQNRQVVNTRNRLWETSEILFPAAQDNQKAYTFSRRMAANTNNGVSMRERFSLTRTQENGAEVITALRRRNGEHAIISISDSGGGIPEEIRRRVFDPLFTTKEVGHPSGQSLAIAGATVVEKHEGSLWFEPNGAQRTTFHISLPLESPLRAVSDEEDVHAGTPA